MRPAFVVAAIIGATALAYEPARSGPFIYDDKPIIVNNPLIRRLDRIPLLFGASYWGMNFGAPAAARGSLYRPLTMVTFALNYRLGGLDPRGYHAVNLLLHIGTSLLLGLLCLRLGFPRVASGSAAFLFALLPVHTEAVCNIVGRSEILAAFFVLLAWVLAIGPSNRIRSWLGGFIFLLALLSKENAAAFWPVLIVSDYALSQKPRRELIRERLYVWVVYAGILLLYLEWRYIILGHVAAAGGMPYFANQNHLIIFLTMAKFLVNHYLPPMILGTGLCAEYSRPAILDARVLDYSAWLCALAVLGSLGYAFFRTMRYRSKMAFCPLIFFGFILPVSNLLVRLELIGAERFLYLPSIGFAMGLGLLYAKTARRWTHWANALLLVLCAWYGGTTFERSKVWADEVTFWSTTLHDAPESARAWNGWGVVMMNQGRWETALAHFHQALVRDSSLVDASYNEAETFFLKGARREAKEKFLRLLQRQPYDRDALLHLAVLSEKENNYRSAAEYYAKVLVINPLDRTAQRNLALLHCRAGDRERCRLELNSYLQGSLPEENNDEIRSYLKNALHGLE